MGRLMLSKEEKRQRELEYDRRWHNDHPKYNYKTTSRFSQNRAARNWEGKEWTISFGEYEQLLSEGCFYCGKSLIETETGAGLDRIDNSKGYTFDNVLPCCRMCNGVRGTALSIEETQVAVNAILELRRNYEDEITSD